MLGLLSTDEGKMWVLQHLGSKHHVDIATLNHEVLALYVTHLAGVLLL